MGNSNRNRLFQIFQEFITKNLLFSDHEKILVCVSGGVDSVVLLELMKKLKKKFDFSLGIAHVNYGLRGKESDLDEILTFKLAKSSELPFYSRKVNLQLYINSKKKSLQESARELRYDFFKEICIKHGYDRIAIAHNANDNAETVLLNLFRGAGISGLKGIPLTRDNIIRPLIFAPRSQILEYAKLNKIKFRYDRSNFKDIYPRNFIRLNILPSIEKKINLNVIQNINNFAKIFNELNQFIEKYIQSILDDVILKKESHEICLDIQKLNYYINFIKENIILKVVDILCGISLNNKKVASVLTLIEAQSGRKIILNSGLSVWKDRDSLVFKLKNSENNVFHRIKIGEELKVPDYSIRIFPVTKNEMVFSTDPLIEYIDGSRIVSDFIIRKWRNEDYFFPLGLKGKKKVSDFLVNSKVRSSMKKEILVLENEGNIVWICGLRLDDRYKCQAETENILELKIEKDVT